MDSYDTQSLRELLLFKLNQSLANEVAEGNNFRAIVFNLLVKALMEGWLLELAQKARDRRQPLKPAWIPAVAELETVMTRVFVQPPPGFVAIPREKTPPEDLHAVIKRYDHLASSTSESSEAPRLNDLIKRMTDFPLEEYPVEESFLLSESRGGRLVAILALTRRPAVRYLPWLSERVAVETPFIGLQAAKAIHRAADTLPPIELDSVAHAAGAAVRWLAGTIPPSDDCGRLKNSLGLAIETLTFLTDAVDRVNRRASGQL
jgi:hypothetical protein